MFLFQRLDKTSGVTEQTDNRYNDRLLHLFLHSMIQRRRVNLKPYLKFYCSSRLRIPDFFFSGTFVFLLDGRDSECLTSVQYNYSHDLFCSTNYFSIFKPIAAQSNSAGSRLLSEIQLCYTSNGYCSMELLMPF